MLPFDCIFMISTFVRNVNVYGNLLSLCKPLYKYLKKIGIKNVYKNNGLDIYWEDSHPEYIENIKYLQLDVGESGVVDISYCNAKSLLLKASYIQHDTVIKLNKSMKSYKNQIYHYRIFTSPHRIPKAYKVINHDSPNIHYMYLAIDPEDERGDDTIVVVFNSNKLETIVLKKKKICPKPHYLCVQKEKSHQNHIIFMRKNMIDNIFENTTKRSYHVPNIIVDSIENVKNIIYPSEKNIKDFPITTFLQLKYKLLKSAKGLELIYCIEHQSIFNFINYENSTHDYAVFKYKRVISDDKIDLNRYGEITKSVILPINHNIKYDKNLNASYITETLFGSSHEFEIWMDLLKDYKSFIVGSSILKCLITNKDQKSLYDDSDIDIAVSSSTDLSSIIGNLIKMSCLRDLVITVRNKNHIYISYKAQNGKPIKIDLFIYYGPINSLIQHFHLSCVKAFTPFKRNEIGKLYCTISFIKTIRTGICEVNRFYLYPKNDIKPILLKYFKRGFGFRLTPSEIKIFTKLLDTNNIKYKIIS